MTSAGGFLLKLDQAGAFTWVRTIENAQTDGVAIDSQDNIVASGIFQGTTDFDPGPGTDLLTSSGSGPHSGFVWKLDSAGNFLWVRAPQGGTISTAYKVAVDSADDVYAVGNFFGRTDMNPELGTFYLEEPGSGDYVWKLDSAGNFVWARSTNAQENYAGVVVDSNGKVFLAPTFVESVDFDPSPQGLVLISQGNTDFAIVTLSQGVLLTVVNPDTINEDLQSVVDALQSGSTGATPADVKLSITSAELTTVVDAINQVQVVAEGAAIEIVVNVPVEEGQLDDMIFLINSAAPDADGLMVEIVLTIDGEAGGQIVNLNPGVRLVLHGTDGTFIVGASPALTVQSGEVIVAGVTFLNSTDAPTILVTGGTLVLRDSTVQETIGGSRAAIEITGGSVDLGTLADPGGNAFDVSGPGELIRNTGSSYVPALGNLFQVDAVEIDPCVRRERSLSRP